MVELSRDKHFFPRIARLAKLDFGIPIDYDPYDAKLIRQAVRQTAGVGLCPARAELQDAFPNAIELIDAGFDESERNSSIDDTERDKIHAVILDLFGVYRPAERRIIIYDGMCEKWAKFLHVRLRNFIRIVTMHEVAHAVTHLGSDKGNRDDVEWVLSPANEAPENQTWEREKYAQAFTYFYVIRGKRGADLKAFRTLADYQSSEYNSWRDYEGKNIRDLNADLRKTRFEAKKIQGVDGVLASRESTTSSR